MPDADTRAGLRLTALAVAAVPALLVTAVLVRRGSGPIPRVDSAIVTSWKSAADRHPWLHELAFAVTQLGGPLVVEAIALFGAALLWRRRQLRQALFVIVAVLGAELVSFAAKLIIHRGRPCVLEIVACPSTFSFPSGHAVGAAAAWLTLALVVRASWREAALALAVVVPLAVAASRVLLGVHYPSDVLAGLALGWAWVVGCAHVFRTWRREEVGELTPGRR